MKVIDGRQFMVIYEFGKYPRYLESVNGGKWYRVDESEVNKAIENEMWDDREMEDHYMLERSRTRF